MVGASSVFSPASRLTTLQRDLLLEFFAREQRFFLTGGAALAGFYLGHRETEDLDFFSGPGPDLADAVRAIEMAAEACGAQVSSLRTFPEFRRLLVARKDERCVVDLVIDRAPVVDAAKAVRGSIRVDTLREIAANKLCTVLNRSEAKDLVDLQHLLSEGIDLRQGLADAEWKDAGMNPATLAWILNQITIAPEARLPARVDPAALDAFRRELVRQLEAIAFERVRHDP